MILLRLFFEFAKVGLFAVGLSLIHIWEWNRYLLHEYFVFEYLVSLYLILRAFPYPVYPDTGFPYLVKPYLVQDVYKRQLLFHRGRC